MDGVSSVKKNNNCLLFLATEPEWSERKRSHGGKRYLYVNCFTFTGEKPKWWNKVTHEGETIQQLLVVFSYGTEMVEMNVVNAAM